MASTDDPADDLTAHEAIARDPAFPTRAIPTFRPDRYLEPGQYGWVDAVKGLGAAAQVEVGEYAGAAPSPAPPPRRRPTPPAWPAPAPLTRGSWGSRTCTSWRCGRWGRTRGSARR